jgi:hypothetical protein
MQKLHTLAYRRALYLGENGANRLFEHDLAEAHRLRPTSDQRRLTIAADVVLEGRHSSVRAGGGMFVHVVQYGPGSHANVIPHLIGAQEAPVQMTPPPDGTDFMDASVAALVSGNHLVFCAKGMRDARFATYAKGLFEMVGFPKEATQFELHKVANLDRLATIHRDGVRSVSLEASIFAASLQYLERRAARRAGSGLLDGLSRVFERDDGLAAAAAGEDRQTRVELRFNKRKGGLSHRERSKRSRRTW